MQGSYCRSKYIRINYYFYYEYTKEGALWGSTLKRKFMEETRQNIYRGSLCTCMGTCVTYIFSSGDPTPLVPPEYSSIIFENFLKDKDSQK